MSRYDESNFGDPDSRLGPPPPHEGTREPWAGGQWRYAEPAMRFALSGLAVIMLPWVVLLLVLGVLQAPAGPMWSILVAYGGLLAVLLLSLLLGWRARRHHWTGIVEGADGSYLPVGFDHRVELAAMEPLYGTRGFLRLLRNYDKGPAFCRVDSVERIDRYEGTSGLLRASLKAWGDTFPAPISGERVKRGFISPAGRTHYRIYERGPRRTELAIRCSSHDPSAFEAALKSARIESSGKRTRSRGRKPPLSDEAPPWLRDDPSDAPKPGEEIRPSGPAEEDE